MTTLHEQLANTLEEFQASVSTANGEWSVKGFIDVYRNIYSISTDTKVVSKIIELMLFPIIARFARQHNNQLILSEHQNHYPDLTFIAPDATKYALDLKSTYRRNSTAVSGFTLGSYTGYFRQRDSRKNITYPYSAYSQHLVLGVIYSRNHKVIDEKQSYTINDLPNIASVIKEFEFLLHEKWQIASDKPGSGNTKNIGSIKQIEALKNGSGPFSQYGAAVFDDYWMNYLSHDMVRAIDSTPPYHNLAEDWVWRNR